MIGAAAARWLLTVVFAAASLGAVPLLRSRPARTAADRVPAGFCAAMCAALIVMTWQSEPAAAAWVQATVFGCAGLCSGLASLAGSGRAPQSRLPALLHMLMAGVMVWMLTAMPDTAGMRSGPGQDAMAMPGAAMPAPVVVVSVVLAVCCAAGSIPWLARAIGTGPRVRDPVSASQAAVSAGMAAMPFAML